MKQQIYINHSEDQCEKNIEKDQLYALTVTYSIPDLQLDDFVVNLQAI